ncbi:MAG: DinB family protein [Chloroflexi bacterium]|nr:DinB family protein [Chloroflexota bacterium]
MDMLDRLLGHDHWATAQLLDLSRDLTDAQLDQEFDIGHRTLRATFEHMIFNVDFWTGLMTGQPIDAQRDDRSLAALSDRHKRSYATFATLSRRFRDEQRLADTFVDHYTARKSFGGTILHVVLHNAEHRTEALHILERLGVPDVPEVDHGLWDYETLNT